MVQFERKRGTYRGLAVVLVVRIRILVENLLPLRGIVRAVAIGPEALHVRVEQIVHLLRVQSVRVHAERHAQPPDDLRWKIHEGDSIKLRYHR